MNGKLDFSTAYFLGGLCTIIFWFVLFGIFTGAQIHFEQWGLVQYAGMIIGFFGTIAFLYYIGGGE